MYISMVPIGSFSGFIVSFWNTFSPGSYCRKYFNIPILTTTKYFQSYSRVFLPFRSFIEYFSGLVQRNPNNFTPNPNIFSRNPNNFDPIYHKFMTKETISRYEPIFNRYISMKTNNLIIYHSLKIVKRIHGFGFLA